MTMLEPGIASIRAQLGIEQEDPDIFHPHRITEILAVAGYLKASPEIPRAVARIMEVGLVYDLRPGILEPTLAEVGRAARLVPSSVRRHRIAWEAVDPELRFDLVRRALHMALAFRAADRKV